MSTGAPPDAFCMWKREGREIKKDKERERKKRGKKKCE
jgi:hypothetical protein